MHNNFYFLRQLSTVLGSKLTGAVISECFSQSKDELIIRFEIQQQSFVIRASLLPDVSCLSFPVDFQRARKNSVDLFPDLIGTRVTGVRQFLNERSFALILSDRLVLLFKMHANRTNVILFHDHTVKDLFRKNLSADHNLTLEGLDRRIDWSFAAFQGHAGNLKALYFTFGKIVWQYLADQGFFSKSAEEQWSAIQSILQKLNDPVYYITLIAGKPALSLLETGMVKHTLTGPLAAANEFYHTFTHLYALSKEKAALLNALRSRFEAGQHYCEKNSARLGEVRSDDHYRLWADLIMANLHAIQGGSEKVVLENFYESGRKEEIRLKKDLSPQKNAEVFYRKAKNQHIEIERLESAVRQKQEELQTIREKMQRVEGVSDLKTLRALKAEFSPGEDDKKLTLALPYHEFIFMGYRIWVGKNAQSNDTLTLKFSFKDDLWLHAKDVSGSHVLVKYQAGKNFPKDVIGYAASLAAFNSKRRNESLCPVIVTPKKFVRKRKGDPAGAVVVEREEVVMVVPARG
ncbi:MAG: NFACT RNA binding domain-containing protein [Chryseosolibacter sp.]